MGCPAKKIVKNGDGAALMKNLPLAREIIETCVKNTNKPVSVKFRSGWDAASINAVEFARMAEGAGASALTIHARTALQGYGGAADRQVMKMVAGAVSVPVIANGDVKTRADYLSTLAETGASAVMVGRATLGKPWLFAEILQYHIPTAAEKLALIEKHKKLLNHEKEFKKHALWYAAKK
jgi:tRNA-dihydrouridine synthase